MNSEKTTQSNFHELVAKNLAQTGAVQLDVPVMGWVWEAREGFFEEWVGAGKEEVIGQLTFF